MWKSRIDSEVKVFYQWKKQLAPWTFFFRGGGRKGGGRKGGGRKGGEKGGGRKGAGGMFYLSFVSGQ